LHTCGPATVKLLTVFDVLQAQERSNPQCVCTSDSDSGRECRQWPGSCWITRQNVASGCQVSYWRFPTSQVCTYSH